MNIQEFIRPELLVLIPVLYLIGAGIKKSEIKDNYIPLILGACGVVLALIYIIATEPFLTATDTFSGIFAAITQGILCAGASVYINQIYKQAIKNDVETDFTDNKGE